MQMQMKKLKTGFEMPVLGFGTWTIGGKTDHDKNNNDELDITAIRQALEEGITHIDTAEMYAAGYAEILVGKAIQGYDRSKLFITTKVSPNHLHHDDLIQSAKQSLKRLQIDYIDLYLIHSPNSEIPIRKTIQAMDELKNEGLIKNIGVSNFNIARMSEAQSHSKNKIVANQMHLNLLSREPERKGVLQYCQQNDIMFIAYRPLQKGMLSIKNNKPLEEICQKYQKAPSQIAINWLVSQQNVVTIVKASSRQHLIDDLGALSWKMEEDDIELLRKDYPNQQDISDVVPLE